MGGFKPRNGLPHRWEGARVRQKCEVYVMRASGNEGQCNRQASGFVVARPVRSDGHAWGWEWAPFSHCPEHGERLIVDLELSGLEVDRIASQRPRRAASEARPPRPQPRPA